jgi:hypothetical protein
MLGGLHQRIVIFGTVNMQVLESRGREEETKKKGKKKKKRGKNELPPPSVGLCLP